MANAFKHKRTCCLSSFVVRGCPLNFLRSLDQLLMFAIIATNTSAAFHRAVVYMHRNMLVHKIGTCDKHRCNVLVDDVVEDEKQKI